MFIKIKQHNLEYIEDTRAIIKDESYGASEATISKVVAFLF